MILYNSKIWLSDLDKVVENLPEISEFTNATILLTGATGLICSSVIDILLNFNEKHPRNAINVIGAGRSEERFNERFSKYIGKPYLMFTPYDTVADNKIGCICDYIVHGAGNTSPNSYVREAVETMLDNFIGMKNLLEYAKTTCVKRILFVSSSEVYGRKEDDGPYEENEYGYVDLLNPRSSYAVSKRAIETLCVSYSYEYKLETVIARPGHIYGPTASIKDKRVASQWAYAAAQGQDIVMKSDGTQIRSYCYCLDCASAILKIILRGDNARAYNISNPNAMISIKEMAQILAKAGGVRLINDIPTEQEIKAFNPMRNSSLRSGLLESLGWKGLFDAEKGFSHTVKILQEATGNIFGTEA